MLGVAGDIFVDALAAVALVGTTAWGARRGAVPEILALLACGAALISARLAPEQPLQSAIVFFAASFVFGLFGAWLRDSHGVADDWRCHSCGFVLGALRGVLLLVFGMALVQRAGVQGWAEAITDSRAYGLLRVGVDLVFEPPSHVQIVDGAAILAASLEAARYSAMRIFAWCAAPLAALLLMTGLMSAMSGHMSSTHAWFRGDHSWHRGATIEEAFNFNFGRGAWENVQALAVLLLALGYIVVLALAAIHTQSTLHAADAPFVMQLLAVCSSILASLLAGAALVAGATAIAALTKRFSS